MELSFNGLRLNTQNDFNNLFALLDSVIDRAKAEEKTNGFFQLILNKDETEQLKERMNNLASEIATLMDIYSDEPEKVEDISEQNQVSFFQEDEEIEPLGQYYWLTE